jgi:hypothetical protein
MIDQPSLFDYLVVQYRSWLGRRKQKAARYALRESELPGAFKVARWLASAVFFVVVISYYLAIAYTTSNPPVTPNTFSGGFTNGFVAGVFLALVYPFTIKVAFYELFNILYFGFRSIRERRAK